MTYTATPVVRLADKLAEITPGDLSRAFFVSGGAEAVETATECGAIPLIKPYSMARLAAVLGEQLLIRGAPAP